jgi:hypothetical protein
VNNRLKNFFVHRLVKDGAAELAQIQDQFFKKSLS